MNCYLYIDFISAITTLCYRESNYARVFAISAKGVLFKTVYRVRVNRSINNSTEQSDHESTFLTVFLQSYFSISRVFDVSPRSFSPPPKVFLFLISYIGGFIIDASNALTITITISSSCPESTWIWTFFEVSVFNKEQNTTTDLQSYLSRTVISIVYWQRISFVVVLSIEKESVSIIYKRMLYSIWFILVSAC